MDWALSGLPQRLAILLAPYRSVSSCTSAIARVSMPYRMPGRSGVASASAARKQGPMPLIATPAISLSPAAFTRSSQIALKSAHHTCSASCSAQPGFGSDR